MKSKTPFFSSLLTSGFEFTPQEELLKSRLKLFNSILLLILFTSATLSITYFFGTFDQANNTQGLLTLIYFLLMITLVLYLRRSKENYSTALWILMVSSLLMFGLTLYSLTGDKSRIQWFGPTVLMMFLLGGKRIGFTTFFASIITILSIHFWPDHSSDFSNMEIAKSISVLSFITLMSHFIIEKFLYETGTLVDRIEKEVEENRKKDEELLKHSKLAQMGELLSIISHQWKQPLSTISMYTTDSIVGLELGSVPSKEEQKEIYLSIEKQVRFLSKTMDDFRNFYNPNKTLKLMYMPHVIEQALDILAPDMNKSSITIHKSFHFTLPLYSYPNEITQAMLILLKNAKDAHTEVKSNKPRRIHISGYQQKNLWVVEVRDNAGGIKPEHLPKIFNQFFTTKDHEKGTGLGLYLCKTIIEDSCRGSIEAELIEDGTLFRFSIPSQK